MHLQGPMTRAPFGYISGNKQKEKRFLLATWGWALSEQMLEDDLIGLVFTRNI